MNQDSMNQTGFDRFVAEQRAKPSFEKEYQKSLRAVERRFKVVCTEVSPNGSVKKNTFKANLSQGKAKEIADRMNSKVPIMETKDEPIISYVVE